MDQDSANTLAPTTIGAPFQGGFYVGLIRQRDGVYALIAAPKKQGECTTKWSDDYTDVGQACSFFDGAANTAAMSEAGLAVATWARTLEIGGFIDWYVPARDELELIYRNLKPTAEENWRYRGDNPSSVPAGYPYAVNIPAQTSVPAFQAGCPEAMEAVWHWSSTQYSRHNAWSQYFDVGDVNYDGKDYEGRARAVRRFKVQ